MVLHFRPTSAPASGPALERTVRFIAWAITNIVASVERSAMIGEETAWEATFEGALDAFAQRLAREPDGVGKAFELGGLLAARVHRVKQVEQMVGHS